MTFYLYTHSGSSDWLIADACLCTFGFGSSINDDECCSSGAEPWLAAVICVLLGHSRGRSYALVLAQLVAHHSTIFFLFIFLCRYTNI